MTKNEISVGWLERARSNLEIAQQSKTNEYIYFEDLCFNAQQCVEKAVKAYCVFLNIEFPKTHNIAKLLTLIEDTGVKLPKYIKQSAALSDYSVEKRYPGEYDELTEKEYKETVKIANVVYEWVRKKIQK